jgi:hypothetical protein
VYYVSAPPNAPTPTIPGTITVDLTVTALGTPCKAFLGHSEIVVDGSGKGSVDVRPGTYKLVWLVFGQDQQPYTIEVTAPPSAVWKSKDLRIVGIHAYGIHDPVTVK